MVDKIKIVRSGALAQQVAERLRAYPGPVDSWMMAHTRILKEDHYGLVSLLDSHDAQCVLKYYGFRSRMHRIEYSLGRGRALHSHRAALTLRREGISVPEPLGCLRVPDGMLLLCEAIPGEGNLLQVWSREPSDSDAAQIMQVAGHTMGNLHMTSYAHGDCKWNNFLWDGRGITLVDLDGVHKAALRSPRQARDLARFTVNAEELSLSSEIYALFLQSYLQVVGATRQEAVEKMVPYVYSMRDKHMASYGPRGQRLI